MVMLHLTFHTVRAVTYRQRFNLSVVIQYDLPKTIDGEKFSNASKSTSLPDWFTVQIIFIVLGGQVIALLRFLTQLHLTPPRLFNAARAGHEGMATAFYNDNNRDLAPDITALLKDDEIPEFLQEFVSAETKEQRSHEELREEDLEGPLERERKFPLPPLTITLRDAATHSLIAQ